MELSTAVPHYYYGKKFVYILITVGKKIELEGKDRAALRILFQTVVYLIGNARAK